MHLFIVRTALIVCLLSGWVAGIVSAGLYDFDLSNPEVNIQAFLSGGPDKDGIPALFSPKLIPASEADFLTDNARVIGVVLDGQARAYPVSILNWHEVVNDKIAGIPVAVTFCPLTNSAVIFDRRVEGETLEFGVSGLLYNSNVVLYDRNSDGLWSQLKSGGLTGRYAGKTLDQVASLDTTWGQWRTRYPDSLVLSKKTGHWRNYSRDPYSSYHASEDVMFPVSSSDLQLPPKSIIVGVRIDGVSKAYPISVLRESGKRLTDEVAGQRVNIEMLKERGVEIRDNHGNLIPAVVAYWFAWSAFYPDTQVYQ